MGYNKFVVSGNVFELYEYEKNIEEYRAIKRKHEKPVDNGNLGTTGSDEELERKLGKRRDNAKRAVMAFRRLVLCQLGRGENPILITLTYAENMEELGQGYRDFKAFINALRYRYGEQFRYVCVPEFQKRGALHFHALFWDLPKADILLQTERQTRLIASLWKRGFVFLKKTDGNNKLSSYLSKYMSKAFVDIRLRNQRAFSSSRNCLRPIVGSGFHAVNIVLDAWELSTETPLQTTQYETKWLGKGRYSLFEIK